MQDDSDHNQRQAGTRKRASRRRRRPIPDNTVPSPCVSVCRYNEEKLCAGCLRTEDEIRDWIIMDREQKLAVLDALEKRRQLAGKQRDGNDSV